MDYLLRQLPSLQFLNGIVVERDAIFSESESNQSQSARNQPLDATTAHNHTMQVNIGRRIQEDGVGSPDLDETNRTKRLTTDEDEDTFKSLTPPHDQTKILGPLDTHNF